MCEKRCSLVGGFIEWFLVLDFYLYSKNGGVVSMSLYWFTVLYMFYLVVRYSCLDFVGAKTSLPSIVTICGHVTTFVSFYNVILVVA